MYGQTHRMNNRKNRLAAARGLRTFTVVAAAVKEKLSPMVKVAAHHSRANAGAVAFDESTLAWRTQEPPSLALTHASRRCTKSTQHGAIRGGGF